MQGVKLTQKEQDDLDEKIRLYELAKARKDNEAAMQTDDGYKMPDSYDADGKVQQSERMMLLNKRFKYGFYSTSWLGPFIPSC